MQEIYPIDDIDANSLTRKLHIIVLSPANLNPSKVLIYGRCDIQEIGHANPGQSDHARLKKRDFLNFLANEIQIKFGFINKK